MRWLLLAALLAPVAAAQALPLETISLEAQAFPKPAPPMQAPIATDLLATISCALADERAFVHATFALASAPAWANAVVSPAEDIVPLDRCSNGYATIPAVLVVTAKEDAPAFRPEVVNVSVSSGSGPRAAIAHVEVPLVASYYGVLDVQVRESVLAVEPGGVVEAEVLVESFGNGPTRVEVVAANVSDGLVVRAPAPFILGSRFTGDDTTARTLLVPIEAAPNARSVVNEVGIVHLELRSAYALDDSIAGDSSSVSFVVNARRVPESVAAVPAPWAGWALLIALALFGQRR